MASPKEVQDKLTAYLTSGDTRGAINFMEDLMRSATRRETPFYNVSFCIKHSIFGELSPLEWAVLINEEQLFTLLRNYSAQQNSITLQNHLEVDLEYLAALSGFKGTLPRATRGYSASRSLRSDYSPFLTAASLGHVRVIETFFAKPQYQEAVLLSTSSDVNKRKMIDVAALHNRAETCKFLLERSCAFTWTTQREAQFRELSDYGNALHIAARFGHAQVLKVLLDPRHLPAGFRDSTEIKDALKYTALGLAVLHVHADAVKELVNGTANVMETQGPNNQTLLQLILSSDCKYREEYFATDKFSRDKIIRTLLDAGASQEGLTEEQLAYIADLHERDAHRQVDNTMVEEDLIVSLKTSSDDAVKPPQHTISPNKKESLECLLCDKKFTSAVSLQAHLKSKGHVKQERKDRLQKRVQPISTQELDDKERKRIGLIERLPLLSELINLILVKLNKLELQRFAATSKSIQMIVDKQKLLWKDLEFTITWGMWEKNQKKPSIFADVAHRLPDIERFKVKTCHANEEAYDSLFDIPRLCTNLRALDIASVGRDYPVSWIGGVLGKCTNLTSLKMDGVVPWKRAKVQAVKDGELNPEQPAPAPANLKKPWKKKKVRQVKKPDPRKWMVDLDTVMQSGSTSLQHLSLVMTFPEDVEPVLITGLVLGIYKRCPNLTSTQIMCQENDNLTSLVLKNFVNGVLDACPKLKRLCLLGEWLFSRLSNAEYNDLFKRFGVLESFKLQGGEISNFDRDIHDYIGDYCTNLKELVIVHHGDIAFNGPHFGLSALSHLTRLRLCKEGDFLEGSDQFLYTVTSQCTKIEKLKLEMEPITNSILQGIAQLGTTLRSLKLTEQTRGVFVNYPLLVRCVNLTHLELQRITVSDVYTIIEHCKKIRTLELYVLSDEDNPANQPQQNNNNQGQNANNNQAQNNNNAQPAENADNNNAQEGENNNGDAVQGENNAANDQQNIQQGAQQVNNNPAPTLNTYIDFSILLEKCSELTDLYLGAPLVRESFDRYVVNTSLTRIISLSSSGPTINTDWPFFYLAECLPNLLILSSDYSFGLTEVAEPLFVKKFQKLQVLRGHSSRFRDFFTRVNEQRANPFEYDY